MIQFTRVSDFAVFVPIPGTGETIALNTLHDTSVLIPEDVAKNLAAGSLMMLADQMIEVLLDETILTRDTAEQEKSAFLQALADRIGDATTAPPRAYLMPSYDCNLKCVYCFQHKIRRTTPSIHMSEKTVLAAFQYLARVFDGTSPRTVTLYGGEPLMAENRSVVEFICAEATRHEFALMASTHAWNLDLYEGLLGPEKISALHITVDGPARVHDRLRVGPSQAATFDRIMAHVEMALRHDTRVRMRVNVDAAVLDVLEEFSADLAVRGFLDHPLFSAYVAPMFATKTQLDASNPGATATLVTHSMLAGKLGENAFLAQVFDGYPPVYDRIAALVNGHPMRLGAGFCCYGARTIVLDPGGNIYPCVFLAGEQGYAAGNYLLAGAAQDDGREWLADGTSRCRIKECKYALYCGGGSPYDSFARSGSTAAPSCDCAEFEETFAGYARAAYSRAISV